MRVLLVEDDADLADVVALGLRNASYAVDVAGTCAAAEELLRTVAFDVACIDLGLPDGDGLALVRRLSADPDLRRPRRALVLTARDAVADRVAGLDAGADDYLVKPFAFAELVARVRALGRRHDQPGAELRVGDLALDEASHRAWRDGVQLGLTAREFALLRYFMQRPGEVLSAEDLLEHVWDAHADPFTSSVRVILSRLRRKLGDPPPIVTRTGAGYALHPTYAGRPGVPPAGSGALGADPARGEGATAGADGHALTVTDPAGPDRSGVEPPDVRAADTGPAGGEG